MLKAIRNDDSSKLQDFISKSGNINEADKKGISLLIGAADSGSLECLKLLLEAGANVAHKETTNGRTALTTAAVAGNFECVDALVAHGQSLDVQDNEGLTALHWAVKLDQEEMVARILEGSRSSLKLRDNNGKTPIFYAIDNGNVSTFKSLLEAGSTLEGGDKNGNSPLHIAASKEILELTKLILADATSATLLQATNNQGNTPLHIAAANDNVEVAKLLVDKGAPLLVRNADGLTPFTLAATDDADSAIAKYISPLSKETLSDVPSKPQPSKKQTEETTAPKPKERKSAKAAAATAPKPLPSAVVSKRQKQKAKGGITALLSSKVVAIIAVLLVVIVILAFSNQF